MFGCNNETLQEQKNEITYFDVKGYFNAEVSRLTKANPEITKTVLVDDSLEIKKIRIHDWKKELAAFSDADMNRNSWKGLFTLSKHNDAEIYHSENEKVPVKTVSITFKNNKVYGFKIVVKNTNALYQSVDTLTYYPDSLYQVKKIQNIRLLAKKNYQITGKF